MSIKGSLVGYEENNKAAAAAEKKHKYTVLQTQQSKHVKSNATQSYMGKNCTSSSLNSSITNSIVTNNTTSVHNNHHNSSHTQNSGTELLQQKYMNSKRKYAKYSSMHPDHMTMMDQSGTLHLNSLWSIWYGVLLTLFQGYLAVHGAYRFLGCSLIPWKIEPVAELNLQIILSGVVFILLPLFFTSAVFKVGNLANDGIKLAAGSRERRCSMTPHDGLEEEANGGTLRALWTHGGPTAAFVHIVIALCLLLPRLLLEAKIIENGLLPKENIWQTELDFVAVNRRNLVVLSVISAPYQNITSIEDDDYYNDTMFMAVDNGRGGNNRREYMDVNNNRIDNNMFITQTPKTTLSTTATTTPNRKISIETTKIDNNNKTDGVFFELPDLIKNKKDNFQNNLNNASSQDDMVTDEIDRSDIDTLGIIDIDDNNNNNNNQRKYDDENTVILSNGLDDEENIEKESLGGGVSIDVEGFDTNDYLTTNNPQTYSPTTVMMETTSQNKQKINLETNDEDWNKLGLIGKQYGNTKGLSNEQSAEATTPKTTTTTTTTTKSTPTVKNVNKIVNYDSTTVVTTTTSTTTNAYDYTNPPTQPTKTHQRNHHHSKTGRKHNHRQHRQRLSGHRRHNSSRESMEDSNNGKNGMRLYAKSTATSSFTTRDSNIHIVKPEKLPEIIPSTPVSSNSKIFEIKTKTRRLVKRAAEIITSQVEIEPEYLVSDSSYNDSNEYFATTISTTLQNNLTTAEDTIVRLDGFSGMLQIFFGIEKPIDVNVFAQPPSAEFINLLFALLVWCVRYPAVFWTSTKSFASVFSVQLVFSALDLIFGYVGVSNLYKLQIYSEAVPIQNPGLILNGVVTLALYLLSSALIIASSMIMYLYGHGRLAAKMRDRSLITLKSSETWIYFAHCASLCYVLALAVVKAPLLNDLSATYKNNLHSPTFLSALVSVVHLLLWIVIWLGLTAKRRWTFKLPPLDAYGISKATTHPLLIPNRASLNGSGANSVINKDEKSKPGGNIVDNNSALSGNVPESQESGGNSEVGSGNEDIYWPKLAPNSPKLKVTFNEVTSTSDDVLLIGDHVEQSGDGKRNSTRGTAVCFTSVTGEIDDGEYATLRAATAATVVGIGLNSKSLSGGLSGTSIHTPTGGSIKILHLSEYDELPPPPPPHPHVHTQQQMLSSTTAVGVGVGVGVGASDYGNFGLGDDSASEEGKLLACVRDDSVTYASTRDLEPPQPPPPPPPPPPLSPTNYNNNNNKTNNNNHNNNKNNNKYHSSINGRAPQAKPEVMQLSSSSPEHLVSPLAPVNVTVHTNEAHITSSSTPRCLRRADSGVPNEALTPRSDTTSTTESTTSPPERAPSESSSGVHSGEERDVEVVIRPRAACKPSVKPPQPVIQEEPYGRCTNMRMSSFIADPSSRNANALNNSATLPPQRTGIEPKINNYPHCSTMPLPAGCHSQQQQQQGNRHSNPFTTASAQSMHAGVSSFKGNIVYANSAIAMANAAQLQQYTTQHNPFNQIQTQQQQQQQQLSDQQQHQQDSTEQKSAHTTLPNGIRYTNPHHLLRRLPHISKTESPYGHLGLGSGHHTFSKLLQDPLHTQSSAVNPNSLMNTVILEDRDSANYSMSSEQDYGLYATANFN